jgi:hypothetical protein
MLPRSTAIRAQIVRRDLRGDYISLTLLWWGWQYAVARTRSVPRSATSHQASRDRVSHGSEARQGVRRGDAHLIEQSWLTLLQPENVTDN